MRSFGFGTHPPTLPWLFVLLSVARLALCAPVAIAGRINDFEDVNQRHPHVLSNNAPKTPLLAPIPVQITSTPATSSKRYTYVPPPTTGVVDTSEPTRPFAFKFPGYSTDTDQDSNANSGNSFSGPTTFRNDDPNTHASSLRGGFPYLSRIPPPRSAPLTFPSSLSTGSSSSSSTTEGSPAVANELSESSRLPLGSWRMNADADALADSSSIAKVFSLKAGTDFVSKNVGLMNPTILRKLKSLVRHGSEKTDDGYR